MVHAAGELGARSSAASIIGISVVTVAADVPAEPHGRPRVRARTRTWANGRCTWTRRKAPRSRAPTEIAFKLLEGAAAASKAWRRSSRRSASSGMARELADAHPFPLSGAADRRAEEHARPRSSPRCGAGSPRIRRTGRASPRGTRSAAAKGRAASPISANILGPDLDQIAEYSKKALDGGAEAAEPHRAEDRPEHLEPRDPRRRRSASAPRTSACAWRPSATRCAWPSPATTRSRSSRKGQEQYPVKIRVLENQRRDIEEIGRLTVPSANGPVRIDNIARDRARPRADARCSARTASSRVI